MGIDNRIVGSTIAELRKRSKMTQLQLAYTLNVSHQAVSKWESGAALPDIQTLLTLTQLFGVTMEQLLCGDIPALEPETAPEAEEKPEAEAEQAAPSLNQWIQDAIPADTRKVIGDLTRNAAQAASDLASKVGSAIGSLASTIAECAKEEEEEDACEAEEETDACEETPDEEDGAFTCTCIFNEDDEEDEDDEDEDEEEDEEDEEEDEEEEEEEESEEAEAPASGEKPMSLAQLISLAPFMSRSKLSEIAMSFHGQADWQSLTSLAPFLSRDAIDKLASKLSSEPANRSMLLRIAPFMSKETLYDLLLANLSTLSFQDLRPFCPFLRREMVDELFTYFSTGALPKKLQKSEKPSVDVGAFFQQTLNGIGTVVSGIGSTVSDTIGSLVGKNKEAAPAAQPPKPARAPSEFKDRIARAALADGNWAWLKAHYTEIGDRAILLDVAKAAILPENREKCAEMLPVLAQILKEEELTSFFAALAEAGNWELIASLYTCANTEAADAVVRKACEGRLDANENLYTIVELYAAKISTELLNEIADSALAKGDWLLINALTDGQDRI